MASIRSLQRFGLAARYLKGRSKNRASLMHLAGAVNRDSALCEPRQRKDLRHAQTLAVQEGPATYSYSHDLGDLGPRRWRVERYSLSKKTLPPHKDGRATSITVRDYCAKKKSAN